ncbi:hypothetical protein NIF40_11565 [[Clostridium] leptum]|nr:hypothetical protein [[Clostridium] leptum]
MIKFERKRVIKRIIAILSAICLLCCISISVYAETSIEALSDDFITTESYPEITDLDKLFEMAEPVSSSAEIQTRSFSIQSEQDEYIWDTYVVDQKLSLKRNAQTGEEVEEHVKTFFNVASLNDSNNRGKYDSTGSVYFFTNIYFISTTVSGVPAYDLTEITGGYTNYSSTAQVVSQKISYGQSGFTTGGYKTQNSSSTFGSVSTSWRISPPSSWVPVTNETMSVIGATGEYTLKNKSGSSTWSCVLENIL